MTNLARSRWLIAVIVPAVLAGGCARKMSPQTAGAEPPPVRQDGSLAEYEADLLRNEQALIAQGVAMRDYTAKSVTLGGSTRAAEGGEAVVSTPLATEDDGDTAVVHDVAAGPTGGAGDAGEPSEEVLPEAEDPAPASPTPSPDREFVDEPAQVERVEGRRHGKRAERSKNSISPRCEMICTLAENTCELESKICSLAERNASDPRYADACDRANDDCSVAQEACFACSG